MERKYYHFYSNGKLAVDLFLSKADYVAAMNRLAVCKARFPGVAVVAFTFEDTHMHLLLFCGECEGKAFCDMFKKLTMMYISRSRGGKPSDLNIIFDCESIKDETYLKKVGTYVLVQPTKDGKGIMPYDYPWSSAPLYFRGDKAVPVWYVDKTGKVQEPVRVGDMGFEDKRKYLKTAVDLPDDWLVCNGIILPSNYVDTARFESVYGTHNAFRAFQTVSGDRDMIRSGVMVRGVSLPDSEMRAACSAICRELYGAGSTRFLNSYQRLDVARQMKKRYLISKRQLSRIVHIPVDEIERYF